jgi:hypothetical protein
MNRDKILVITCCNSAAVIRLSAATNLENETGILKMLKLISLNKRYW